MATTLLMTQTLPVCTVVRQGMDFTAWSDDVHFALNRIGVKVGAEMDADLRAMYDSGMRAAAAAAKVLRGMPIIEVVIL